MAGNAPNPIQMNFANRANLIQTGLYMTKQLQPVTATALGQQVRIPLDRMGIMTGVILKITIPVNIGVAQPTVSQFGPYNAAQLLSYTDYSGLLRVNTNGWQLHALNSFKMAQPLNNAVNFAGLPAAETFLDTNILHVPTAVANNDSIQFFLYVPMAYDPATDLRGAVLSQTITGDHYITIQLPNALIGADPFAFPYVSGGGSTVALGAANGGVITVQAFQQYIMPQQGVNNLPMVDLSTIYSIEGNLTDSSNIAAGQNKWINWPNNRAVLSALHVFDNGNGGVANGADLSQIVLLGNSNTNIREMSPALLRAQMRAMLMADLPSGCYYLSSRNQPITTQLYGNVQTQFSIVTANANPYFASQFESFYLSGTPLPGVIQ